MHSMMIAFWTVCVSASSYFLWNKKNAITVMQSIWLPHAEMANSFTQFMVTDLTCRTCKPTQLRLDFTIVKIVKTCQTQSYRFGHRWWFSAERYDQPWTWRYDQPCGMRQWDLLFPYDFDVRAMKTIRFTRKSSWIHQSNQSIRFSFFCTVFRFSPGITCESRFYYYKRYSSIQIVSRKMP